MVHRRQPTPSTKPPNSPPADPPETAGSEPPTHTRRRAASTPRLVNRCAICTWDGTEPAIWGPFKQQQWATPEHDLCTDPDCMRVYKERARAGTL
jgi:hypothetical protein